MGSGRKSEEKTKLVPDGLRKRNQKSYGSVPNVDNLKSIDEYDGKDGGTGTTKGECIYIVVVVLLALIGIIVGEATLIPIALNKIEKTKNCLISVDPGVYPNAAITTDDERCSTIARDVLQRDGSAVDAAIAAMLCIGVVVSHSAGIGGGHFMTIYDKDQKLMMSLNSREKAPGGITEQAFNNKGPNSPLVIGVPGEIKGMWKAHQRFGRLPWSSLFEDSIRLCRDGTKLAAPLASALISNRETIRNSPALSAIFWNTNTSDVYKEGDLLKRPKLGDTLQRLALGGEKEFYEGETAKILAQDVQAAGGLLTTEDLKNYEAEWTTPVTTNVNGMQVFGPGAPAGTSLVLFIMNVMEGYKLTPDNLKTTDAAVLTYHRLIESYKNGHVLSVHLGDPKFSNVSSDENLLKSEDYAEHIRLSINDDKTFDPEHYNADAVPEIEYGTSHISILAPDGSAVAVTTTINYPLGSGVVSPSTGIILNNQLDDFGIVNGTNGFGLTTAPENVIAPGKQPASSMSPIIMINQTTGNVTAVIGASGGSKIPSAVTQVSMLKLWLGKKVHEAVAEPRVHHQLYPNVVQHEIDFSQEILDGLKQKGHKVRPIEAKISTSVNAIFHTDRCVRAAADSRKGGPGATAGF